MKEKKWYQSRVGGHHQWTLVYYFFFTKLDQAIDNDPETRAHTSFLFLYVYQNRIIIINQITIKHQLRIN